MQTARFANFYLLLITLLIASCGTFELGVEKTPASDQAAIATLSALMLTGTQRAALLTQQAILPTSTPDLGTVTGKICYPGAKIPAMTAFFRPIDDNNLVQLPISANQEMYSIHLPPGKYLAFIWNSDYQLGGLYSQAVPCGLSVTCTDHSARGVVVEAGKTLPGIDLCDWAVSASQLPIPANFKLP